MDLRIIVLLVMTALLFGIGLLVFFRNRKNAVNISYGFFVIFMAIWSFGLAMFYYSFEIGLMRLKLFYYSLGI